MTKRKVGRPSKYSERFRNDFCARIAAGRSLHAICRDDEDMPSSTAVFEWLAKHQEFADNYARAREARTDAFAEEIIQISDETEEGETVEEGSDHNGAYEKTVRADMIAHRKLRVDTRKWLMARMAPKKYGDKVEQTLKGDADAPLVTRIELVAGDAGDAKPEGSDDGEVW